MSVHALIEEGAKEFANALPYGDFIVLVCMYGLFASSKATGVRKYAFATLAIVQFVFSWFVGPTIVYLLVETDEELPKYCWACASVAGGLFVFLWVWLRSELCVWKHVQEEIRSKIPFLFRASADPENSMTDPSPNTANEKAEPYHSLA